ncbi:MAG: glutamine amidotransferase-related protein, partial [Bacteroidales bacterium]
IINSSQVGDTRFTEPLVRILEEYKISYKLQHWSEYSDVLELKPYDAVLISASPKGNNANFYHRLKAFQWLKTFDRPVFGICAGHQLTGVTFGSRLIRDFEGEEGLTEIKILKEDPIFEGSGESIIGEQHHNDSISLPEEFDLLASTEKCEVQAIRHKDRPIYTFQWHVEISNPELIRRFVKVFLK